MEISGKSLKQRHRGWLEGIAPFHEKLTKMSWACATLNPKGSEPCSFNEIGWDSTDTDNPLVKGVRWNDDPNNLFEGGHPVEWVFWLSDAETRLKEGRLDRTCYLTYRSHFLDLQFLHAMSQKGQSPAKVRRDILDWCRFAYDVATGRISPDARIFDLRETYPFAKQFDGTGPVYWTVRKLFTNVGQDKYKSQLKDVGDRELRLRVAGALLHTIQDSYSRGHTERETTGSDASFPSGPIRAFLDYASQNSKCHGETDLDPDWASRSIGLEQGPVFHGAWLVRRVLNQDPWDEEATTRFEQLIFPLSDSSRRADGGACAR